MWFKFPQDTTEICVEQQNFYPEIVDPLDNRQCFRAPAHFSGLILMNRGFEKMFAPPPDAPEDVQAVDPVKDKTINELNNKIRQLDIELSNTRADLAEVTVERDDLKLKFLTLEDTEISKKAK